MNDGYDLEHAIRYFQLKGFCAVPREYKEKFKNRIDSLGLMYSEPRVDTEWACWIFENKELNK